MKKAICMVAVAAISFGSVNAFAGAPLQTMQDTSMKMKKKPMKKKTMKKKMKDSTMMKKDTMGKM
ncbi:hypothetical protein [Mucilaginibacter sp.]|uniref:hypothetical protein n=1 Tax=Mucilaginibacter sp. TaxID=1882438 RepID=UPI0035BBEEF4